MMCYNVVFKNIAECRTNGAITWTSFKNKEHFDKWYDDEMRGCYEVVAQGVTEERAIELCSQPEAEIAIMRSLIREARDILTNI